MIRFESQQNFHDRPFNHADCYLFPSICGNDAKLTQMCFWEYARECRPLIEALKRLKKVVSEGLNLEDPSEIASATFKRVKRQAHIYDLERDITEQYEMIDRWHEASDEVEAIAGRFNWSRLCSQYFPAVPWLDLPEVGGCAIAEQDDLFRPNPFRISESVDPQVANGERMAYLHRPSHFEFGGDTEAELLANIEQADFVHGLSRLAKIRPAKIHVLVLRDECLDFYEPEAIAAEFRRLCHARSRKRLVPAQNQRFSWLETLQRGTPKDMLQALAVARFYAHLNEKEQNKLRRAIDEAYFSKDSSVSAPARIAHKLLEESYRVDFLLKACGRMYRQMFNTPETDNPISVPAKYVTDQLPRKKKRKNNVKRESFRGAGSKGSEGGTPIKRKRRMKRRKAKTKPQKER